MIGQGPIHTHSSPPPHPDLQSLVREANVDMLACSPFDGIGSSPPPNIGDPRRPSAKAPHPCEVLKCPRCDSLDTKFCYYNNYSLTQPRYFCKNCKRYWTAGGALRNVPVGGGLRKNKRSKLKLAADAEAALAAQALAAGVQHQHKDGALGAGTAGEVPRTVDNRTGLSANAAMPLHHAVGVPELGMYSHSSRGSTPSHYGEPLLDQNNGAVANQQEPEFYSKNEKGAGMNYFGESGHVPQFFSKYATSLPIHYVNPTTGGAASGYAMNYNFLPSTSQSMDAEAPVNDKHSHTMLETGGTTAAAASRGEVKQEKDGEAGNPYDWQLVSEGLFNGGGAMDGNFFYMPASSWPDFSQFNDTGAG